MTGRYRGIANLRGSEPYLHASLDQSQLSDSAVLKQLDDVNIDLDVRDTMWSVYFVPTKLIHVLSFGAFPVTPPDAEWTLVYNEPALTGDMFEPVTSRFRLMRTQRGPHSNTSEGLASAVTVGSDSLQMEAAPLPRPIPLTIQNTGTATWLTAGAGGVVDIAARLLSPTGDVLVDNWVRQALPLTQPSVVPPGATVQARLAMPALPDGSYVAEIQMVSEGVAFFGPKVSTSFTVGPGGGTG